MASPSQPQGDYAELSQLALRITKHLQQHPHDAQAKADLKYVTSQIPHDQPPVPEAYPGRKIAAGLVQAGLDIPKGVISAAMHPIQAAGQITGFGNAAAADSVFHDPEASIPEKLDALLRATPLNMGYAAERGLLNATGAKSDEAAPLTDQAHAVGNVASLALLGVNKNTPGVALAGRVASRLPIVGPLTRVIRRYGAAEPVPAPVVAPAAPVVPPPDILPSGNPAAAIQASLERLGFKGAVLERAMEVARQQPATPTLLGATGPSAPMPGNPQGLLGPEGISPAPKASYPQTLTEMQGFSSEPRSPLLPTDAEAATTAAAKALKLRAREAARTAYIYAISHGQTVANATAAAQRAAAMIGLLAP